MTISGLAASCDERLFVPQLRARNKDEALVELADCLVASGRVRAREVILHTIRERERIWPTAIGKGVAIPHARSLVVPELILLFARSPDGIDFGAEDGEAVKLVFLIVAPYHDKENRYLPTLGKLVELVSQEANRKRLLEVAQFSEFLALLEEPRA
jgi:mannitol/fructose-specific phosphotransferase system IIA component (Ntr-type)